jgi:hypothetical protein
LPIFKQYNNMGKLGGVILSCLMPSIMLFVLAVNDADLLTFVGVVMHNHVVNLSILLGWHCIL